MRRWIHFIAVAFAMCFSLASCSDEYEEPEWDGGGVAICMTFDVYNPSGEYIPSSENFESLIDGFDLRIEYDGEVYYTDYNPTGSKSRIASGSLGLNVRYKLLDDTVVKTLEFGYLYPEFGTKEETFKLKYLNSAGETVTHDIKVEISNWQRATEEHPRRADLAYYIDGVKNEGSNFTIVLR